MTLKNKRTLVLSLTLMALMGVSIFNAGCSQGAPTASSSTPAAFQVSNLRIEPSEIKAGEKVTVSAEVKNAGGSEGSYTAELKVNGMTEGSQNLTIPAGTSSAVTFTVSKDTPGVYQVGLGNLTGQFTVIEAATAALRTVTWSDEIVTQLLFKGMPGYSVHIQSKNNGTVEGGPIGIEISVGVSDGKIYFVVPSMAYDYIAGGNSVIKTYTEYDGDKLWLTALPPWVDPTKEIAPDVDKLPYVESITTKGGAATITYRWP
jgi:CARDB